MDINKFKKLENKVKKKAFSDEYKSVNNLLFGLSIFGNIASIFLASLFLHTVLKESMFEVKSDIVIWIVTIILLISLELFKRDIFNKFSKEFLRYKTILVKEVSVLFGFSILVITLSFYATISGANQFSSKNESIVTSGNDVIKKEVDSISNIYSIKIKEVESQNAILFDNLKKYDERIENIDANMLSLGSSSRELREKRGMREEINSIRKDKELNKTYIDENDKKILAIKAELNNEIAKINDKHGNKINEEVEKNNSSSFKFVIISTLIELLILLGVYFNRYFDLRTYLDMKHLLISKDNYKKMVIYHNILDTIFKGDMSVGKLIPNIDSIYEIVKNKDIYISKNEFDESINLFKYLNIIDTKDDNLIMNKELSESKNIIKEYLDINKKG